MSFHGQLKAIYLLCNLVKVEKSLLFLSSLAPALPNVNVSAAQRNVTFDVTMYFE